MSPCRIVAAVLGLAALAQTTRAADDAGLAFFENKVRPVLVKECYSCHSAAQKKAKGQLELDSAAAILKGGESGPAVVPGKPDDSPLVKAVRYTNDALKMPPKAKLPDAVVADLAKWVQIGAPMPKDGTTAVRPKGYVDIEAGKQFWSFRPLTKAELPAVKNTAWVRTPVDRFILAKLEEKGLTPNRPADREKLIRRAYFALTGLPPTPAEIDAFVNDPSPEAWGNLIDRLLASERYGERWARHWLDVARFAESGGYEFDGDRKGAHHYRDFVIRALNRDMPYDEFVRLQLAGDKLAPGNFDAASAAGFLVAGPYPGQTTAKTIEPIRYDQLDDMISTTGSAFLGLTVGCARCHEHKYDPIPQEDYYRLLACIAQAGATTANVNPSPDTYSTAHANWEAGKAKYDADWQAYLKDKFAPTLEAWWPANRDRLAAPTGSPFSPKSVAARQLAALLTASKGKVTDANRADAVRWATLLEPTTAKAYAPLAAHLAAEPKPKLEPVFTTGNQGGKVYFLIRGETGRKGAEPAPGFIQVLMSAPEKDAHWVQPTGNGPPPKKDPPPVKKGGKVQPKTVTPTPGQPPDLSHPRVALANWMTDEDAGAGHLAARVIVNRLWQHHLGRGIVGTPNDFGAQGDRPTHPELLDFLAAALIRNDWRLKPVHKLIMMSAVYMQSGDDSAANRAADPDNKLWWRRPPLRLEGEAIRDSLLAVGGTLDTRMYGPGTLNEADPRRSVYLTVKRSKPVPLLHLFDAPEAIQSIGKREVTTVPTQALTLMNSPLVRKQAEALAKRVRPSASVELPAAVEAAYRTALGRRPTTAEAERAAAFVRRQAETHGKGDPATDKALADLCQALLCSNEFVYVD